MPRWKVLVSAPHAMPVIDRYRAELVAADCEVVVAKVHERLDEAALLPLVGDVDGIICGDDRISARVLDAAPRLRVISKWGTGTDSIDRVAAADRGVAVCNTANAFSEPVADTVMGYVLLFARRLDVMTADMRAGVWASQGLVSLGESTLGIVGLGNCGLAVARRAAAFGARILAHDARSTPVGVAGLSRVPLDELLAEADFITLHVALQPSTVHLMNAARLAQMKRSAYLINTSRGAVVDERALVAALQKGQLAGAALDVFEEEPLPATSALRTLPNVQLAPHSANRSPAAAERVHVNTIRNLLLALGTNA